MNRYWMTILLNFISKRFHNEQKKNILRKLVLEKIPWNDLNIWYKSKERKKFHKQNNNLQSIIFLSQLMKEK